MTGQPINLVLLAIVVIAGSGIACLCVSPEALERLALKMRARARALLASHDAYWDAYSASYEDDKPDRAALAIRLIERAKKG